MRALIVDDSQFTRRVLRGMLKQAGFESDEANNAASGLEMVKKIRAQGFGGVKVVMVTCNCDSDGILQALEAGADEYLMKPFDCESLRGKLALMGLEAA